jgi:hypothetical protein
MHNALYLIGVVLALAGLVACAKAWPEHTYFTSKLREALAEQQKVTAIHYLVSGIISGLLFIGLGSICSKITRLTEHFILKEAGDQVWNCPGCGKAVADGMAWCKMCGTSRAEALKKERSEPEST